MDNVLAEALPVLQVIIPGFVVTFIFYWLSDAPKPGQFERVIQSTACNSVFSRFTVSRRRLGASRNTLLG